MQDKRPAAARWLVGIVMALGLAGCGGDGPGSEVLDAHIVRTTSGVPHIEADTLEEAGAGAGYAQARDNACLIAEAVIKARGERARFFGPGPDDINIIKDFSYRALELRSRAAEQFELLSEPSRKLIRGFAAGYNAFLADVDAGLAQLPPRCAGQAWVREISGEDLFAYYRLLAQLASGDQFSGGPLFEAVPPGESVEPVVVSGEGSAAISPEGVADNAREMSRERERLVDFNGASNGWGIGGGMTENGRGALLANPHFPYTGPRRLYQMHLTVPGVLDFHGAGLIATPIPQIGFNEHLAWTHTTSTSNRFTGYELKLKSGDPLTYIKDGQEVPIEERTIRIEVADGSGGMTTLQRTFYFSEHGPMLSLNAVNPALPAWGDSGIINDGPAAFTYRDANEDGTRLIDTWFRLARASNLDQFKDVFRTCGSTLWVNTMYADAAGNAFYVDSSSVPALSDAAEDALRQRRENNFLAGILFNNGFPLLDGSKSRDDWVETKCNDRVTFRNKPRLERKDFVQNSNDSYWATNPDAFLTGFSQLYGAEEVQLQARPRMNLKMLQNPAKPGFADTAPAGPDGEFDARELIETLYNNRAFRAEQFLDELLNRCDLIGTDPVNLPDAASEDTRRVDDGCAALASWDGVYDLDSEGAHLFRLFMGQYLKVLPDHLTEPFDPTRPVATPDTPAGPDTSDLANDPMLVALATGLHALDKVGIAPDAPLREVQRYQPSGGAPPGGTPRAIGPSFPWHGGNGELEGAFNVVEVVDSPVAVDTRFPIITPTPIDEEPLREPTTGGLAKADGRGWPILRGASWHFGLAFEEDGPEAFGLVSYSQSTDSTSRLFNDQSERYANKNYRPLLFDDAEIEANKISETRVIAR